VGGMWLYASRGIGVIAPPIRFNCRPEVTLITLV
jgi:predicted MPP superfamily phosphohydrolase